MYVQSKEMPREGWHSAGAMDDSITEHFLIMSTTCNIFSELLLVNEFLWNLKSPTFGTLLARSLRWKREEGVQGASLTQPLNHNQHCSVGRAQFLHIFSGRSEDCEDTTGHGFKFWDVFQDTSVGTSFTSFHKLKWSWTCSGHTTKSSTAIHKRWGR